MSLPKQITAGRRTALALLLVAAGLATIPTDQSSADTSERMREIALSDYATEPVLVETRAARRLTFDAWRADTVEKRSQGLMFVGALAPDRAMIFVYDRPQVVAMWMKNTLISLDMLFVDTAGCVADLHERATPESLETIQSAGPVALVVELPAGTVEEFGLAVGDRVRRPSADWPPAGPVDCRKRY